MQKSFALDDDGGDVGAAATRSRHYAFRRFLRIKFNAQLAVHLR